MNKILPFFLLACIASIANATKPLIKQPMQSIEVAIQSPATNYAIEIKEIRKVGDELWVLSQVRMVGDLGGAAITEIKDRVEIPATGTDKVKHFVAGKSWNWAEPKTVTYLPKEGMTDEKWKAGEVVWKRPEKKKD